MYGVHSIAYSRLESFFYVFAVRQQQHWLSWEEVQFYAAMFDFPTVPEIPIRQPLSDFYQTGQDENRALTQLAHSEFGDELAAKRGNRRFVRRV